MEFASASYQVVLDKFATMVLSQVALICNVDDDYRKLQRTLFRVQAMIDHVETNLGFIYISRNQALKTWLQDVEKFSYDADDLLDKISLKLAGKYNGDRDLLEDHRPNKLRNMVLSSPKKLGFPNKIKKISDALEIIAKEMESLSLFMPKTIPELRSHVVTARSLGSTYLCNSSSFEDGHAVVGKENEIREMINRLLLVGESKVSIIPIVGMGGIGKTTLAQIVYNNADIDGSFKLKIWVSVSPNFDVVRITKSIIESATGTSCKMSDLHSLQTKLQKLINTKRFLLVLDDYWSDKHGDWELLFSPLRAGCQGGKIIVTTRSETVAAIISKDPVCYLKRLDDDECWELMKQKAFSYNNIKENRAQLVDIGRKIAKKCKGLPLAAQALGGVLHFKSSVHEWFSILESVIWDLPEVKDYIFQSLALSYYHLPAHLKKCFAYCSIFPRNYEFQVDEMVLLWMAEGFIVPRGKTRLEDIGNEYFMDLARRSFFQWSFSTGGKHIYKMHDLIHDMAQLVSSNTSIRKEYNLSSWPHEFKNPRHLSFQLGNLIHNTQPIELKAPDWYEKLRTFIVLSENTSPAVKVPYKLFAKLKSVRVLNLSATGINELHVSIEYLKHLRYLNLSNNQFKKLPEEITKLCALETLNLKNCTISCRELPTEFKNLTNLRHLHMDVKRQLKCMPPDLGNLSNLQTLSAFIVGTDEGCSIAQLKSMNSLRKSICITNLENVSSAEEAKQANLRDKAFLEKLELEWSNASRRVEDHLQAVDILTSLEPHENVKDLVIIKYGGPRFPNWLGDPLCKLRSIQLQSCYNCDSLPSFGLLPYLKSLHIKDMPKLRRIVRTSFPELEVLKLEELLMLEEWEESNANDMSRLQRLIVMGCHNLIGLPPLHNVIALQYLEISSCSNLESLPLMPLSLQHLIVEACPIIEERRLRGIGEEWEQIERIETIEIGYQLI